MGQWPNSCRYGPTWDGANWSSRCRVTVSARMWVLTGIIARVRRAYDQAIAHQDASTELEMVQIGPAVVELHCLQELKCLIGMPGLDGPNRPMMLHISGSSWSHRTWDRVNQWSYSVCKVVAIGEKDRWKDRWKNGNYFIASLIFFGKLGDMYNDTSSIGIQYLTLMTLIHDA